MDHYSKAQNKIKILFVTPAYKPYLGGVERVVEQISRRLLEKNDVDDVGILTTSYDFNKTPPLLRTDLPDFEIMDGVKIYRRSFHPKKLPFFYHLPVGVTAPVGDVIEQFNPNVIHFLFSEWFLANYSVYRQSRDLAHVFSYFYHPYPGRRATLMHRYIRRLCKSVDYVHVVSHFAAARVEREFGISPVKIKRLPLGVNRFAADENPKPMEKQVLTILSVGRLSQSKGQVELVRLFAELRPNFKHPARLLLVGGDGGRRQEILSFVKSANLEEWVDMPGYVNQSDLNKLYERSDIFCLLSQVESFGLVFFEAMGFGLPVVAYGLEPIRELLTEGAVLVDPGNLDQVKKALTQLVNDNEYRLSLSRQANNLLKNHPTWAELADELAAIYQQALSDNERK